ncbi:zona pellucida sperm-binding protein 1-like [Salarias fasciatus]|uniref:zona pellucida sperm-binding protein 1-like n=1 Tax=Salarias fasciatus TaxID=181472 RepID=UPI001176E0CC|nr:zona pellucida sperm-binding protein 1-like [Salarias fasciatus]
MEAAGVALVLLVLLGAAASLTFYGDSLHFLPPQRNRDGDVTVTFFSRQNGRSSCQDESSFSCRDDVCSRLDKFRVLQTDRDDPGRGRWCQSEGRSTVTVRRTGGTRSLALTDSGCCWVSNVAGIRHWTSGAELDLGTRSDSKSINRCPVTAAVSSLRYPQNCFSQLRLLAHDPDGDSVRCRYANETAAPSNFTLDQTACTISRTGEVQIGVHVFEVMLEDFPVDNLTVSYEDGLTVSHRASGSSQQPLCKVKLQFTVDILDSLPSCEAGGQQPVFLSKTPSHGQVLRAAVGETVHLYAPVQALRASVEDFQVSGPQNITKAIRDDTAGDAELTLSWTPQEGDVHRDVPLCFTAQTNQTQSEMRCVVVMVTDTPADHGKASVRCWDGKMAVVLEKASMPGIDVNFLRLQDPNCSLSANATHITGAMSLHTCGTTLEDDGDFMVFRNEIRSFEVSDAVITRRKSIRVGFSCRFPKALSVSSSFAVHKSEYVFTESGFGSFSYAFEIFRDGNFSERVLPDRYPVEVRLMETVYMGIQATAELGGVQLFVESCVATPDDDPGSNMTYDLIKDGCIRDETLQVHKSPPTSFNFQVQAFKFTGDHDQVFITCTVLLCDVSSPASRCALGCLKDASRRRRRGLDRQTHGHEITQGPLQFVRPDPAPAGNRGNVADAQIHTSEDRGDARVSPEDASRFQTLLSSRVSTAVFAVAFLVAVAILVAVVRYYRTNRDTEDTGALMEDD